MLLLPTLISVHVDWCGVVRFYSTCFSQPFYVAWPPRYMHVEYHLFTLHYSQKNRTRTHTHTHKLANDSESNSSDSSGDDGDGGGSGGNGPTMLGQFKNKFNGRCRRGENVPEREIPPSMSVRCVPIQSSFRLLDNGHIANELNERTYE